MGTPITSANALGVKVVGKKRGKKEETFSGSKVNDNCPCLCMVLRCIYLNAYISALISDLKYFDTIENTITTWSTEREAGKWDRKDIIST